MTTPPGNVPRATMRLQLHKGFTFADATAVLPYVAALGISHVYSSPVLTARPGSLHGYDVTDPTRVNAELGGESAMREFVAALRASGLGLIVDIVPNHMAVGGSENPWWADVLRNGRGSRYAGFFDIDWDSRAPGLRNKVLAPFLGKPYGQALADGELRLRQSDRGEPVIDYHGNEFPITPADYAHIQEAGPESFDPATTSGREMLHALLERQHYRLAWWATAGDEINWRRFFDINALAGLRVELPEVFEATHATLFRLYATGLIDGFRIDHVDGLSDPAGYCRRLRQRLDELAAQRPAGAPPGRAYIVVEKILARGETLPVTWDVDGTTGYDFMNDVSALQHDQRAADRLGDVWHAATGRSAVFEPEEAVARKEILERGFEAPLQALARALHDLAWSDLTTRDTAAPAIRRGLMALLSHFPVYRGYNMGGRRTSRDDAVFALALDGAKRELPVSSRAVLDQIDRWLGGEEGASNALEKRRATATLFHQLSAPVAAKAVEDTAFYRYGRLLSRNDVGFDPALLGSSVAEFHAACVRRRQDFPHAMLATATHDHKRGEDARARLAVISEIPEEWARFIAQIRSLPSEHRPEPADEIMLYQAVIGAWPLDLDRSDEAAIKQFAERLAGWQQKALREAKLRTDWQAPDTTYEALAADFLKEVVSPASERFALLQAFVERTAAAGCLNGLAQAALKLTVPGVPDFFQGTEFWDFSLVDPDNRRPVDFNARRAALQQEQTPDMALRTWRDGRVKQSLVRALLAVRGVSPDLFACGTYEPLTVAGPAAEHILAFALTWQDQALLVLVPRLPTALMQSVDGLDLNPDQLHDLHVELPPSIAGRQFTPVLSQSAWVSVAARQVLAPLLRDFPIAVLRAG